MKPHATNFFFVNEVVGHKLPQVTCPNDTLKKLDHALNYAPFIIKKEIMKTKQF